MEFFEMLNDMAKRTIDDNAAEQLWQETEDLEGVFSEKLWINLKHGYSMCTAIMG